MIKKCVQDSENPNTLFGEFVSGVGEYFLPTLGVIIISVIICTAMSFCSYIIGMKVIGDVGIPSDVFVNSVASNEALKSALSSLTIEQVMQLDMWRSLLFLTVTFTQFILMFYSPALFFNTKNPIKALFESLKRLFGKDYVVFIFEG